MDHQDLHHILERVETGTTTVADAEALRALFGRRRTEPAPPSPREEARHEELTSERVGSCATVRVAFVRDRYTQGEFHIQTTYRLPGGGVSFDRSHRVRLAEQIAPVTRALWDVIFDAACEAQQFEPAVVIVRLNCTGLDAQWTRTLTTIAQITAHELRILVAGTAPDPREFA